MERHFEETASKSASRKLSSSVVVMEELLRESLPKTGPLRFASENQFPLNFAHEYILVQK